VLTRALANDPDSSAAAEGYYIRGLAGLKLLKHSVAAQDFRRAIRLTNREDLRANAHVCLGSIAYERGQWDEAYKNYQAAEGNLTHLSPSDWILYRLASSAQRSGRWEEGKQYYARIIREFPNTDVSVSARKNLKYDYFTIQVGAFSDSQGAAVKMNELRRLKLSARVDSLNVNGRTLKVVTVGRYNDYDKASKGLGRIRKIVPDARIVP
jgi:tetratricopeptide (TPR) repeat protein